MRAKAVLLLGVLLATGGAWLALPASGGRPASGGPPPAPEFGRYEVFQRGRDFYMLDTATGKVSAHPGGPDRPPWRVEVEPPRK